MFELKTLFCITLLTIINFVESELRFVFYSHRHGARSPVNGLSASNVDILGEQWSNPGELLPSGMRMHYLLGTKNRLTYSNLMSPNYVSTEIYYRSSDYNRTINSAQSHLTGLYPPPTGPSLTTFQENVDYPPTGRSFGDFNVNTFGNASLPDYFQVVPIHLFDNSILDYQFFYNPALCPEVVAASVRMQGSQAVLDFIASFKAQWGAQMMKVLNLNSLDSFDNYSYLYLMFDTFVAGYTEGKPLASMTSQGIDLSLFNQTAFSFLMIDNFVVYNGDSNLYLPIWTTSVYAKELLMWMDNRIYNDMHNIGYTGYAAPKMAIFSAHDYTLGAILTYLQNYFGTEIYYTPFASCLYFELYRPDDKAPSAVVETDYTVNIIYNDIPLKTIAYTQFKSVIQANYWDSSDIRYQCSAGALDFYGFRASTITLGVLLGFDVILCLVILIICCCGGPPKKEVGDDKVISEAIHA